MTYYDDLHEAVDDWYQTCSLDLCSKEHNIKLCKALTAAFRNLYFDAKRKLEAGKATASDVDSVKVPVKIYDACIDDENRRNLFKWFEACLPSDEKARKKEKEGKLEIASRQIECNLKKKKEIRCSEEVRMFYLFKDEFLYKTTGQKSEYFKSKRTEKAKIEQLDEDDNEDLLPEEFDSLLEYEKIILKKSAYKFWITIKDENDEKLEKKRATAYVILHDISFQNVLSILDMSYFTLRNWKNKFTNDFNRFLIGALGLKKDEAKKKDGILEIDSAYWKYGKFIKNCLTEYADDWANRSELGNQLVALRREVTEQKCKSCWDSFKEEKDRAACYIILHRLKFTEKMESEYFDVIGAKGKRDAQKREAAFEKKLYSGLKTELNSIGVDPEWESFYWDCLTKYADEWANHSKLGQRLKDLAERNET